VVKANRDISLPSSGPKTKPSKEGSMKQAAKDFITLYSVILHKIKFFLITTVRTYIHSHRPFFNFTTYLYLHFLYSFHLYPVLRPFYFSIISSFLCSISSGYLCTGRGDL
jgi:hypothetical protein